MVLVIYLLTGFAAKAQLYRPSSSSSSTPATTAATSAAAPQLFADTVGGYVFTDTIEAKLVRLALDGPQIRAALSQNRINELQLKGAKNSILNLLTLSLNYNDQSFGKPSGVNGTAYVYPKYFFGFVFPLGTVFSRTQVKAAREQIRMGKENQELLARSIRSDVLSKYRQYKVKAQQIKMQNEVLLDEEIAYKQVEKSYRDNTITLEALNVARKKYNDEVSKKLNLQLEIENIRLDLERMIGTNLESVINVPNGLLIN